jgi:putative intracellular protease/amidase
MRQVTMLVVDAFADWEAALAMAELRHHARLPSRTVSFDGKEVVSMGGLRVQPDGSLQDVHPEQTRLLVLPGSPAWEEGRYPKELLERVVRQHLEAGVPVGAVCGATVALARGGFFQGRRHTSNDPHWLRAMAPDYPGQELYQDALATTEGPLITASGTAPAAFATELLAALDVYTERKRQIWNILYTSGRFPPGVDPNEFFAG